MKKLPGKKLKVILITLLVLILIGLGQFALGKPIHTGWAKRYWVMYVIDGDTIAVRDEKGETLIVRYAGIDCPESVASDEYLDESGKENSRQGELASAFNEELVEGKNVRLEFAQEKIDDYGRSLCYVTLENGTFVNSRILSRGYGEPMLIKPNYRYGLRYYIAYWWARYGLFPQGIWADSK